MNYNEEPQPEVQQIIHDKDKGRDLAHEANVRNGYSEELYNNSVFRIRRQEEQHTVH